MSDYKIRLAVHGNETTGYWWRIVSRNGQVVAHSEIYDEKFNAMKAVRNFWGHLNDGAWSDEIEDNTV